MYAELTCVASTVSKILKGIRKFKCKSRDSGHALFATAPLYTHQAAKYEVYSIPNEPCCSGSRNTVKYFAMFPKLVVN